MSTPFHQTMGSQALRFPHGSSNTFNDCNILNADDIPAHRIDAPSHIILTPISGIRYIVSTPTSLTTTHQRTPAPTSVAPCYESESTSRTRFPEDDSVKAIQAHHDVPPLHTTSILPFFAQHQPPDPGPPPLVIRHPDPSFRNSIRCVKAIRSCHDVLPHPLNNLNMWRPNPVFRKPIRRVETVHDVDHADLATLSRRAHHAILAYGVSGLQRHFGHLLPNAHFALDTHAPLQFIVFIFLHYLARRNHFCRYFVIPALPSPTLQYSALFCAGITPFVGRHIHHLDNSRRRDPVIDFNRYRFSSHEKVRQSDVKVPDLI
ncbi:hypothetical protein D9611_005480 [Ephemerocybe angulata]|uniref:Uncharacterized protein n=1 Tax=Ephemerocybe angulata TaxID=980116 RepID=A0A8H5C0G0_9AGAR|nr:hypothetical protein D9611_005480 [Tulosesus angulatus]